MPYDFNTLVDRSRSGSVKYELMLNADPETPPGIIPLSIGDMELKTPPEIVEGLKQYLDTTILGYTSMTQADKDAVINWFSKRHDWEIRPEWILGIDGVVPALYTAVEAYTNPGDGVIFMPPVYRPLYHAIHHTKRTPVEVPLVIENNLYAMDFDALETAASRPDVRLLLFCSPHNPVARVWTEEELLRLGEICLRHNVIVVSDEIHMDFVMPGHKHRVFPDIHNNFPGISVVCTAPSKTFNIAGLQVSNIIIPDPKLRKTFRRQLERGGRFGPNQLGLAACRIAYEKGAAWLEAALALIHQNANTVSDFMTKHYPEIHVLPHEGTYFIWLDFRQWNLPPQDLERFMIHNARLFLDEGPLFGPQGNGFERINLACPSWLLQDSLTRLLKAGRP